MYLPPNFCGCMSKRLWRENASTSIFLVIAMYTLLCLPCLFTCVIQEDVKDWTIDVLTDALTRVEESVRNNS